MRFFEMNNIFVYIENEGGKVADVSLELLTKGRELATTLGVKLEAVVLGHNLAGIEKELAKYGADTVWVADDPLFSPFRTLPHTAVLCGLIGQEKPQIALFGATPVGRDFAPRVSSALHSGLTADCTQLEIGDHKDAKTGTEYKNLLYQIRPAFGGNIIATIVNPDHRPQMATVREGVMRKEYAAQPGAGSSYSFDCMTAACLGGVSIAGGEGKISGTVIGVIILGILDNGLVLMSVNTNWQSVIKGLILLAAVAIDCYQVVNKNRKKAAA